MARPHSLEPAAALIGRFLLSAIFLHEAWSKVFAYSMTTAYMQAFAVPGQLLPFAIGFELGCGLPLTGLPPVRAAILFHTRFADRNQLLHFEKDLAIAGGFLMVFAQGSGAWSIDALKVHKDRRTAIA